MIEKSLQKFNSQSDNPKAEKQNICNTKVLYSNFAEEE